MEEPSHCPHLGIPSREEVVQLEGPLGSLFASVLFWDRILMSPKPSAFGGRLLTTQATIGEGEAAILVF